MELSFIQCGFAEAFDYCQFMIIKLNSKQSIAKHYSLPGKEMEDIERAEKLSAMYSQADERLKLFFDCEYKNTSFMSKYLYETKNENRVHTIDDLATVIRSDANFKNKLIQFYMGEPYSTNSEVMHRLMTDFHDMGSCYKEMLMYYLMFEEEYMTVLFDSMEFMKETLKELYQREETKLKELTMNFDFDVIAEQKRTLKKWAKELQEVEVSFSICNPYVVAGGESKQYRGWLILGCDYAESMEHRWDLDVPIEQFSNALGDEMRIRIIKEVQTHGEMSAPQLAKIMNLPSSAIFYHLDILRKAAVLCSRLKGRTAYYWINQNAFEKMIMQLKELGGLSHG